MASTGEPDRKRRHFSSISPSEAAAAVKKQPFFWPSSEDKVLSSSSTFVHALYIYMSLTYPINHRFPAIRDSYAGFALNVFCSTCFLLF